MAIETRTSNDAYERLVLEEPDQKWELWDGVLREKPGMTFAHADIANQLGYLLMAQLDRSEFRVRVDSSRVHRPSSTYFVPDVVVVPLAYAPAERSRSRRLEVYDQPLPLVVEVWSPSTGDYDIRDKLAVYQERGDVEIWFIHPFDRTLTAWRRQPGEGYAETVFTEGIVHPIALPGVSIDLAVLFDI